MEELTISQVEEKKEDPLTKIIITRIPMAVTEDELLMFFELLSFGKSIEEFELERDQESEFKTQTLTMKLKD